MTKVNNHFSILRAIWTGGLWLLLLGGCGPAVSDNGKKVFSYNESDGIATLDPAFAKNKSTMWAAHQIYSTLVETDNNLHFVPGLARTWEVSVDRKVWTFHLRTDVFFHDDPAFPGGKGRKLVAADVVYSFNRILDPLTASSGAWIFHDRIDTTGGCAGMPPGTDGRVLSEANGRVLPCGFPETMPTSPPGGGAFVAIDDSTFRLPFEQSL